MLPFVVLSHFGHCLLLISRPDRLEKIIQTYLTPLKQPAIVPWQIDILRYFVRKDRLSKKLGILSDPGPIWAAFAQNGALGRPGWDDLSRHSNETQSKLESGHFY